MYTLGRVKRIKNKVKFSTLGGEGSAWSVLKKWSSFRKKWNNVPTLFSDGYFYMKKGVWRSKIS